MIIRVLKIALLICSVLLLFLFLFVVLQRNQQLQMVEITVGAYRFQVEIADEPEEWQQGLVGHKTLGQGEGMLFVFPFASKRSFWTKDMGFPIDIVWIRANKVVGFVDDAQPGNGENHYFSPEAVNVVLEIAAGERQRLGIESGDAVKIER